MNRIFWVMLRTTQKILFIPSGARALGHDGEFEATARLEAELGYDPAAVGVIASAKGRRRFVRAVANASSLAVRTTTICS